MSTSIGIAETESVVSHATSAATNQELIVNAFAENRRPFSPAGSTRPTTNDDLFRLAAEADQRGVRILTTSAGEFYATSSRAPGLIYHVSPSTGCQCHGYQRHQRCTHYAALLNALGVIPFTSDRPEVLVVAQLLTFRDQYDALRRQQVSGAAVQPAVEQLLAQLEVWLVACEAMGFSRDDLRDEWRNRGSAYTSSPAAAGEWSDRHEEIINRVEADELSGFHLRHKVQALRITLDTIAEYTASISRLEGTPEADVKAWSWIPKEVTRLEKAIVEHRRVANNLADGLEREHAQLQEEYDRKIDEHLQELQAS